MDNSNYDTAEQTLDAIKRALTGLRFGSIEIVVHDSKVVQIERKEKVRIIPDGTRSGGILK